MVNERYFRTSVPEGFEWALPAERGDFKALRNLDFDSAGSPTRRRVAMTLLTNEDGRQFRHAFLPWFASHTLVLRDEAIEVVGQVLRPHGELVELDCETARLSMFVAPTKAGFLDEEKSDLERFSSGRIMSLRRPVFRCEAIAGVLAFRLAEMPRGHLYLSESIVEAAKATGLAVGTNFEPVGR